MQSCLRALVIAFAIWLALPESASAQGMPPPQPIGQYYYYPYHYFPHSYWPTTGPKWPENAGEPYMRPPAYMAYPAFKEPHWRYDLWERRSHYRGFHFWLDAF